MEDFFRHHLRKGTIEAGVVEPFVEGIGIADTDDLPYEESVLGHVADELYLESANAIDDDLSPLKNHNDQQGFRIKIRPTSAPFIYMK